MVNTKMFTSLRRRLLRHWPVALLLLLILPTLVPAGLRAAADVLQRTHHSPIAPFFTETVQHWQNDLIRWSEEHQIDPNLMATVMQIESCGHPTVVSSAGAQGLFQVMPFHFDVNEVMTDPNTNAYRGMLFLNECLRWAEGDPGRAMACYNGGPGVLRRSFANWPAETQRYYLWGAAIYNDAYHRRDTSETLSRWLSAGGQGLCNKAANSLQLVSAP